ncbi:MAG: glycosyltransferase family 10 domain-containing protein [Gemmatimonas sp.]
MRPRIAVNFALFWETFDFGQLRRMFPQVCDRYELVLSEAPEVVFYSVFADGNRQDLPSGECRYQMPVIGERPFVRVFMTGENAEPVMSQCDFAISFSRLVDHPNHLRLPLWVYRLRDVGLAPEALVKDPNTDWEQVAAARSSFCNFIYAHDVAFRNAVFTELERRKSVDAVGRCMNNRDGWRVPDGIVGKVEFLKRYRFTLAVENAVWPGYATEKLVEPMLAGSVPIYIGDPQAQLEFEPASYVDFSRFGSLREMLDYVIEVDSTRDLYLRMLSTPWLRDNRVPDYARDETIVAFFDRIFAEALARRGRRPA